MPIKCTYQQQCQLMAEHLIENVLLLENLDHSHYGVKQSVIYILLWVCKKQAFNENKIFNIIFYYINLRYTNIVYADMKTGHLSCITKTYEILCCVYCWFIINYLPDRNIIFNEQKMLKNWKKILFSRGVSYNIFYNIKAFGSIIKIYSYIIESLY